MYEENLVDIEGLVKGFCKLTNDSVGYGKRTNSGNIHPRMIVSNVRWVCPEAGVFKVNCDAAVRGNALGLGAVIRNDTGAVVAVASLRVDTPMKPPLAEMLVALVGIKLAVKLEISKVILEVDAIAVVRKIRSEYTGWAVEALIIEDIKDLSEF